MNALLPESMDDRLAHLVAQREEILAIAPLAEVEGLQASLAVAEAVVGQLAGLPTTPEWLAWRVRRMVGCAGEIAGILRAELAARGAL